MTKDKTTETQSPMPPFVLGTFGDTHTLSVIWREHGRNLCASVAWVADTGGIACKETVIDMLDDLRDAVENGSVTVVESEKEYGDE